MGYNLPRVDFAERFIAGRDAASQERRQNALLDLQMKQDQRRQQAFEMEQQQSAQTMQAAQIKERLGRGFMMAAQGVGLERLPQLFLEAGEDQESVAELSAMPPEQQRQIAGLFAQQYGFEIPQAPAAPSAPAPIEVQRLPNGAEVITQGGKPIGSPRWPDRPKPAPSTATPPPRKPSPGEEKARRDAMLKMPRVDAAMRRVDRLGQIVSGLSANRFLDGGPIDQYALRNTKQGQELVQAAASLLPELTALTRVPGIGAQSDLEQRLAALQLPSLEFAPEVNQRALEELRLFLNDLRAAYQGAAGQASPEATPGAAPTVLRFDANGRPITGGASGRF